MGRKPIVGGNWKCNPDKMEALDGLIGNINACSTSNCEVYVCPSPLHTSYCCGKFTNGALVTPQNMNFKGCGAFTGEMAVEQMKDLGIRQVLIGHSERRGEFGIKVMDTNDTLAAKLKYALDAGMKAIFCIGERKEIREQGLPAVLAEMDVQLTQIYGLLDAAKVVIAYEPVWAIGTGLTATPQDAQDTHAGIRKLISEKASPAVAEAIRIQYGGSANAKNAPELSAMPDIDGFLVGGAALKPEFKEIVAAISAAKPQAKPKVTIVGAGNAAHALAALLPSRGFETSFYCPYMDEAERLSAGVDAQGFMMAKFADHCDPAGEVRGKPVKISKDPAEVIPDADVILMPLPSFTYRPTLEGIKAYLHAGQKIGVTPGQGAFDWIAREVLGEELFSKLTLFAVMPMPFNCRIADFGKEVHVQEFKRRYRVGCLPVSQLDSVLELNRQMFGYSESCGSFLACSLYPINAIIHPARLYTLLEAWTKTGEPLAENPLFYEQMGDEAGVVMDKVNKELIATSEALKAKGIDIEIPHIFDFLAKYVYEDPSPTLVEFFRGNAAYKGFRCPLKSFDNNKTFVPDFTNRYFTEDIPSGVCLYKGVAELAGTPTPTMDMIILWAQQYMEKEYIKDGKFCGEDVKETIAPQSFGMKSLDDLVKLYAA